MTITVLTDAERPAVEARAAAYQAARKETEALLAELRGLESMAPPTIATEKSAGYFAPKITGARHSDNPARDLEWLAQEIRAAIVEARARVEVVEAARQALAERMAADPAVKATHAAASAAQKELAEVSAQLASRRTTLQTHEAQGPANLEAAGEWDQRGRQLAAEVRYLEVQAAEARQAVKRTSDRLETAEYTVVSRFTQDAQDAVTEARKAWAEARRALDEEHGARVAAAAESAWAAGVVTQQ